jgi:hypothetical protein
LHQQHIREAVEQPGLTDRHFMGPVLATFVFALPVAFRDVTAQPGTAVHLHIEGEAGGDWALMREPSGWRLYAGEPPAPVARTRMDQETAWRLFTKGMSAAEAVKSVLLEGDLQLGRQVLHAVSIIA